MLERATGVESEIDRLLGELRSAASALVENLNGGASALQNELESFRVEFAAVREARLEPGRDESDLDAGPVDSEPETVAGVAAVDAEVAPESDGGGRSRRRARAHGGAGRRGRGAAGAPAGARARSPQPPEADTMVDEPAVEAAPSGRSIRGAEGARLIALNMALNGTPRDETARYLAQNFELDDQDALLDEVYARVGG